MLQNELIIFIWTLMMMVNFPHNSMKSVMTLVSYLRRNIPEYPAYGVFVAQLIRYVCVCLKYENFLF